MCFHYAFSLIAFTYTCHKPSVLWRCWLGSRKGIWPVKTEWWVAGVVICLEWGADLHMAQLMPLPLAVSCFSKIQIGFTFLVLAHPGSPGKRAVKRVCVCYTCHKQMRSACLLSVWFCLCRRLAVLMMMNMCLSWSSRSVFTKVTLPTCSMYLGQRYCISQAVFMTLPPILWAAGGTMPSTCSFCACLHACLAFSTCLPLT